MVNESAKSVKITVRLNAASPVTVTVNYATANNTALAGSDYTATNGTLVFAPSQTSRTFTVLIRDDALVEPAETVTVTLSSPVYAGLGSPSTASIIIDDNDLVYFGSSSYTVNEGTASVLATVRLSAASSLTVSVRYSTTNGTATAGSDYTAVSGTLTFSPGQTSKTFTVPIINDALQEPSESAVLALSNPVNASIGAASSATLWITDNDGTP